MQSLMYALDIFEQIYRNLEKANGSWEEMGGWGMGEEEEPPYF